MISKLLRLVPDGGQPYCEPFCGAANLLFARESAPNEVINDINDDIVNVFRCLQDKTKFEELRHRLLYTPYARSELKRAIEVRDSDRQQEVDDVTRAWAFLVRMNFGISGHESELYNWGRTFVSTRGVADCVNSWLMRLVMLDAFHWRLMRVQIDNRDALEVLKYWDNEHAVFYVDPPYHPDTRERDHRQIYRHEVAPEYHTNLVDVLLECRGAVVLSCYDHAVYQPLRDAGWEVLKLKVACYAAARVRGSGMRGKGAAERKVPRVETVYRNPKAVSLKPVDEWIRRRPYVEEEHQTERSMPSSFG